MGKSRASKEDMGCVPKDRYEHRYANGEQVNPREDDYRNALNYETHADGDSVGDHWMQNVHPKKGALHAQMHIPQGKKISTSALEKATHAKSSLERKRANLALRYRGD
jgi:hypothetical protein